MQLRAGEKDLSRRTIVLGLVALFILALALRAGYRLWRTPFPDHDQMDYRTLASNLAENRGYAAGRDPEIDISPLFPVLHAGMIRLGPDPTVAGAMVAILFGSLIPVAGARFVGKVLGWVPGLLAGLVLAVEPHLVLRSGFLEPEGLAALLYLWLANSLIRGKHVIAGVVLGLACLTRPEAMFLIPILIVLQARWRVPWRRIAASAVLCLALASMFQLYLRAVTDEWHVTGKDRTVYLLGVNQWRTRNVPIAFSEIRPLEEEIGSPYEHLAAHPKDFVLGCLYRFGIYTVNLMRVVSPPLWPLVVLGFIQFWRTDRRALCALLLPFCLIPAFVISMTFYRHVLLIAPIFLVLAGAGIPVAWRYIRERVGSGAGSGRLSKSPPSTR